MKRLVIIILIGFLHASVWAQGSFTFPPGDGSETNFPGWPPPGGSFTYTNGFPGPGSYTNGGWNFGPTFFLNFGSNTPSSYVHGYLQSIIADGLLYVNVNGFLNPASSAWLGKMQPDDSFLPVLQMDQGQVNEFGVGTVYMYSVPITGLNDDVHAQDVYDGLWGVQFQFGPDTFTGLIQPVPEPSPAALTLSFGALALCVSRYRRARFNEACSAVK